MGNRENKVEKYLDSRVKAHGGFTRKWTSPGHVGVPDRLCFFPCGVLVIVEVKTKDGKLSEPQRREMARLVNQGFMCYPVFGVEGVKALEDKVFRRLKVSDNAETI